MKFYKRFVLCAFAILICTGMAAALMGSVSPSGSEQGQSDGQAGARVPAAAGPWIGPIIIASESGKVYEDKVSVQFHPTGTVYVAFMSHDEAKSRKDIWLYKYIGNGLKGELVGKVSGGKRYCYEPDMIITPDGTVHIAWAECDTVQQDSQLIMYRSYKNGVFSPITVFKNMNIPGLLDLSSFNKEKVDDLNLSVDDAGNIFMTFMTWPAARGKVLSKYGSAATKEEVFPVPGRSKHPCIKADGNYVNLVWQHMLSQYTVIFARRPNVPGAAWKWQDLKGGVHRPVMDLDRGGNPHIFYMADDGDARHIVYKYWMGNKFSARETLTEQTGKYQNVECSVNDAKNMIVGSAVFKGFTTDFLYNWKRDGKWQEDGVRLVPGATGAFDNNSVAISKDNIGAFAYNMPDVVCLILSEQIAVNELPVAVIHANKNVFYYGDTILFDGNGSTDADGHIVKYDWDFGDGEVASGIQVSHAFVKKSGDVVVKLTVTDDKGGMASATLAINVLIQPPQPVINSLPDTVYWQDTVAFDGSGSSDPYFTIVKYAWDFGDGATATGDKVSHAFVSKYGDVPVKLTVTNDKDVSATATRTIKVNALFAANATFEKTRIRTLFHDKWGYIITWGPNIKNSQAGYSVSKYRIMRKAVSDAGDYAAIDEVDAATTIYRDMSIEQTADKAYTYVVCAVDANGHVSPLNNF